MRYIVKVWTQIQSILFCPGLCGGAFNATSSPQTITSPMYPNAYPPFTTCRWVLDAPSLETVKVTVQQFGLQPSQSCSSNYLELKDWPLVSHAGPSA